MIKRVAQVFVLVVIIAAIVYGFLFLKKGKGNDTGYFNTVPQDAGIVLKVDDVAWLLTYIKKENEILNLIVNNSYVSSFANVLRQLNQETENKKAFLEKQKGIVISFHNIGKNSTVPIFHCIQNKVVPKNTVDKVLEELYQNVHQVKRKYEGFQITDLQFSADKSLSYVVLGNKVLLSPSALILESAIRQFKSKNALSKNNSFTQVCDISGKNVDANLYVNLTLAPKLCSGIFNDHVAKDWADAKNVGNWVTLDLNLQSRNLVFTGFAHNADESKNLSIFAGQEPVEINVKQALPANVVSLQYFGVSNLEMFGNMGKKNGLLADGNISFQAELGSNFNAEIAQATLSSLDGESEAIRYFLIAVKSGDLAKQWLNFVGMENEGELSIDQNTKIQLFKSSNSDVVNLVFGKLFRKRGYKYACVFNNYIVFGRSSDVLKAYVHQVILGKTLGTDNLYNTLEDHISDKANYFSFNALEPDAALVQSSLKKDLLDSIKLHSVSTPVIGMQLTASDSMLFTNIIFAKSKKSMGYKPKTVWETLLDTVARYKPVLVDNHYTHEKEIFIQDLRNNVYLINKVGRILWKQKLNEPINSEVYQVDFYKNNKLQLLFSTTNKIHLLDRNGNYVEKYPVNLRAGSKYGIALFDYDNNRNYRVFVGCADKKVYAYDIEGNVLDGWAFGGAENQLASKIHHFVNKGKDYIVFADQYKIYILNRRGENRVNVNEVFKFGDNVVVDQLTINGKDGVCFNQQTGNVTHISYDGIISEFISNSLKQDHGFNLMDINGNRKTDFITTDNGKLSVMEYNNPKWEKSFNKSKLSGPDLYKFSANDVKVGFVNYTQNNIYLFNNNGKIYTGFPLNGASRFTIGRFNTNTSNFNLLVCSSNSFLLNYSVK